MATVVTRMHLSVICALPIVLALLWETFCVFWVSLYWCLKCINMNFGVVGYNQDLEDVFCFGYENCFEDVG